ncbi:LysR family transcriptional regulator [Bordetella petrii]|uniref:LysR family transcriptional regulator n=1 Tax=Bordetella petrii TaxID=94624 RepID=UPI001A977A10|nr:LysR family transcriptional regulator [Bordetella petrii]MBO1113683.1 LysR family transcriptional regulator [Bordetella petrii]
MRLNFNLLSTFLAVAENSSFRAASAQVHLSLPAVSMQIKQLEERLGVTLFHRTTRKVGLTPEGEQLMISARKAMAELDVAFERIQRVADLHQGNLSFACVPTVAGTRLPALLTRFAHEFPRITVKVREVAQPGLLAAVRKREVDFGIGVGLQADPASEFESQALFDDDYVAVFPAGHPFSDKRAISLRELSRTRLLALGASQFRQHLLDAAQHEKLALDLSYEFTHVNTVIAMIEAGLGIGILPAVAIPQRASLRMSRVIRPSMKRTIAIIRIKGHSLSPAALQFVDMCGALAGP